MQNIFGLTTTFGVKVSQNWYLLFWLLSWKYVCKKGIFIIYDLFGKSKLLKISSQVVHLWKQPYFLLFERFWCLLYARNINFAIQ